MGIVALLSLIGFVGNLILGLLVLALTERDVRSRLFSLVAFSFALVGLGEFLMRTSTSLAVAYIWMRLTGTGWVLTTLLFFTFSLYLTQKSLALPVLATVYGLGVLFLYWIWTSSLVYFGARQFWWGYGVQNGPLYPFFSGFLSAMVLLGVFLIVDYYRKITNPLEKRAVAPILIGPLFVVVPGIVQNFLLGHLDLPSLTTGFSIFMNIFVAYGIFRYGTFRISPITAAPVILRSIPDVIFLVDLSGKVLYVNPRIRELLGVKEEELMGKPIQELLDLDFSRLEGMLASTSLLSNIEATFRVPNGTIPVIVNIAPIRVNRYIAGYSITVRDIRDLKALIEELRNLSITDPLTGVYNRRYFFDALRREIERIKRYGGDFSVFILDLDDFKDINDTYGHLAGDEALRALGKFMREHFRKSDIICRYGGDEFGGILTGTSVEGALRAIANLRQRLKRFPIRWEGQIFYLTFSAGVTSYRCVEQIYGDVTDNLIVEASDTALYRAKSGGKGITETTC